MGDRFVAFSELGVASFELEGLAICSGSVRPLGSPVSDFEAFAGTFAGGHCDVDGGVRRSAVELGEFVLGAGEADL